MANKAFRHGILALAMTGLLGACVEGPGGGIAPLTPTAAGKRAASGADVEAPEVFQVTDTALWDGRPSLGGIWVASADAVDPERVMLENLASGKSVEGALFRRERDNPGPALQLSSDAAEALGILAGQPSEIRVTALRRAEPEVPDEAMPADDGSADVAAATGNPAAAPVGEAGETADADADEAGAKTTAAVAAAALAATEGTPEGTDPALAGAETIDLTGTGAVAATGAEAPAKTRKERRAEAKAAREAKKAVAAAAKAAKAAKAAAVEAVPADGSTVDATGVAAIETAPLDARAPEVSAAATIAVEDPAQVEAPKPKDAATAEASPDPAKGAAGTAAPATKARSIQIASFSQEVNATNAVASLAKIGLTAQVRQTEVAGKPVWGIIAVGDAATLKSIRGAGFPDAYFLQ